MIPKNHTYQLDKTDVWLINNRINRYSMVDTDILKNNQRTIIYIYTYRSPIDHRYHRHLLVIGEIIYIYIHIEIVDFVGGLTPNFIEMYG